MLYIFVVYAQNLLYELQIKNYSHTKLDLNSQTQVTIQELQA